jgi:putative membrane protein
MSLAYAHGGDHVHQVGGVSLLTDWTLDPAFLVPLLIALLYFRGLRRYRRQGGRRFSPWRQGAMGLGVFFPAVALLSPLDILADWSFTFHMFQHELLMSFAAPALLLSQPFLPVVWGLPEGFRRRVFIPFARNRRVQAAARFLTHPVVGLIAYSAALLLWHMPFLYDAAFLNDWVHYGQHFSFIAGAALFWWGIVTPYPFQPRLHVFLRIMLVFVSEVPNIVLSAMVTFSDSVIYAYGNLEGFWGASMLHDQQMGGLLMWVGVGATVRLAAALMVLIVYARAEALKEPPRVLYPTRAGVAAVS